MTLHLPYGGSTASRTIGCPGWVKKSEGIPSRPAGQAAIDGSMHHEVQEMCQRDGTTPDEHIGFVYKEDGNERVFTEDDLDLANIAYHQTNEVLECFDIDEMMIEPFVQLIPGEVGGSIDVLGLSEDGKTILLLDYKFGRKKVKAAQNAQLQFYAMCAERDKATADMFKHVVDIQLVIIQPHCKKPVDVWRTNLSKLHSFAFGMDFTGSGPTKAGDHCLWCPAEPYCDTKRKRVAASNLLGARLQDELQAAADIIEEVEAWVKSMHEEMYLQMNRGVPLKGWKIVEKRPSVKWTDADAAREFFKEKRITARDITNPAALRTPKQVMDYLKKKGRELDLDEFIVSKSSGTTLATEDDSREAVVVSDVQGHLKDMME